MTALAIVAVNVAEGISDAVERKAALARIGCYLPALLTAMTQAGEPPRLN